MKSETVNEAKSIQLEKGLLGKISKAIEGLILFTGHTLFSPVKLVIEPLINNINKKKYPIFEENPLRLKLVSAFINICVTVAIGYSVIQAGLNQAKYNLINSFQELNTTELNIALSQEIDHTSKVLTENFAIATDIINKMEKNQPVKDNELSKKTEVIEILQQNKQVLNTFLERFLFNVKAVTVLGENIENLTSEQLMVMENNKIRIIKELNLMSEIIIEMQNDDGSQTQPNYIKDMEKVNKTTVIIEVANNF